MSSLFTFFHREHGASRAYLFSKLFLLMLALDTWMLMIGHAGRYGVAGFNVAHFGWLDAIAPTPSARSYVAVLLLTGLLALVVALTGIRRLPVLLLFLLYSYSWSMSMLDSYQHHYFVSLILFCLVFFPETSALEIHPPPPSLDPDSRKRKHRVEQERGARAERAGSIYVASVLAITLAYARIDSRGHTFVAFFLFAAAIGLATWYYGAERAAPLQRPGFGFSLLGATVAIVYTFTAIAKMDKNWVQGHTMLQISAAEQVFAGPAAFAARHGIDHDRFFSLLSTLVIPQELALAGCYLLAVHRDRMRSRLASAICTLGFVLAVVLHVGAEAMGLQIGWFSYYMLALACCFLLPLLVVDKLATVFTWPARFLLRATQEWESAGPIPRLGSLALAVGCGLLLLLIGRMIDLPGSELACSVAAAVLLGTTLCSLYLTRARDPRRDAVATAIAAAGMWLALATSSVRWDFYRYLGGDQRRRGELDAALETYVHGERYAPPGESRSAQIKELRQRLGR
ncbi:MAG: hypothetical protein ACHQ53_02330 [Polyangiales bacterium]